MFQQGLKEKSMMTQARTNAPSLLRFKYIMNSRKMIPFNFIILL